MSKKKLIVIAILIFVALFIWGSYVEAAEVRIGLGKGQFNVDESITQDLMLTSTDRKWYAQITRIGNAQHVGTVTRFSAGFRTNWRKATNFSPYLRLGMAAYDKEPRPYISDKWSFDMRRFSVAKSTRINCEE